MAVQTTYSQSMAEAIAGLLYDMRNVTVESYASEGGNIPFGRGVVVGADPRKTVKLPTAGSQTFRGIAIREDAQEQNATTGVAQYLQYDAVNTLRKGAAWCPTKGAVAADAAVYMVMSGDDAGLFSDDSGDGDAVPTGVFRSATSGSGLALVEINLP